MTTVPGAGGRWYLAARKDRVRPAAAADSPRVPPMWGLPQLAAALAALTGEPHPLAEPHGLADQQQPSRCRKFPYTAFG